MRLGFEEDRMSKSSVITGKVIKFCVENYHHTLSHTWIWVGGQLKDSSDVWLGLDAFSLHED